MKIKQPILISSIFIITVSLLSAVFMPAGGLTPKVHAKQAATQQKKIILCVGEENQLNVKNLKGKNNIKWKSSNPKAVSVSAKGLIFGKRKGSAKITLSYQKGRGKHAKKMHVIYKVKVENYIKSMEVSPQSEVNINVGDTVQIQATIYPLKTKKNKVVYESENKEIASVSTGGVITAIKEGQVRIKVTSVGKTADKKNLQSRILVRVEKAGSATSDTGEQGTPGKQDTPDTSGTKDTGQDVSTEPTQGTPGDSKDDHQGQDETPVLSGDAKACIDALPKADKDVLVPGVVHATYSNGEDYTLYFINLKYEGVMTLTIGEYTYSLNTSPSTALRRLETMGYAATNSSKTIRVERKCIPGSTKLEEWWKVTELTSGTVYELKGMRKDTIYANKHGYGIVVVKGDTRDVINIS